MSSLPAELPVPDDAEDVGCERCGKLVWWVTFEGAIYALSVNTERETPYRKRVAKRHELTCRGGS